MYVCVCCQRCLLSTDFGMFVCFSLVGVCPNNKVEKRRQQEQEKEDGADAEEIMEKIKLLVSASTMHHAHASFDKHTQTHTHTNTHASFPLTLPLSPHHARR